MRSSGSLLACVFGLVLAFASATRGAPIQLAAIEEDTGDLHLVSTADASVQWLGSTGLANVGALEFNPHDGMLYAITSATTSTPAALHRLTMGTAPGAIATQYVGDLGFFAFEGGLAFGPTGVAYGMNVGALRPSLFTLDLATGKASVVGGLGERRDISGLTWRSDGQLIGLDSTLDELVTIDPNSAAIGPVKFTNVPVGGIGGMTMDGGVGYYVTAGPRALRPGSNAMFSFDPFTGDQTFIGDFTGVITGSGFSGLSIVPEPTSLCLLAAGGFALLRRRQKRGSSK